MTTWILLAGLPGTGKSTLAKALAGRLGAAVLDKDLVRAALFPGKLTDYSAEQAKVCMQAMIEAAVYLTRRRDVSHVVFDGRTFSRQSDVDEVLQAATRAGARWRIVHLVSSDAVAMERLARIDPDHPAKNRDSALYLQVKQRFEPILQPSLRIDTSQEIGNVLFEVETYLQAVD